MSSGKRHDCRADFAYSYSRAKGYLADLYERLLDRNASIVSHLSDSFTKTTALFSGIEVKAANGIKPDAEYQVGIFMGASLRKKAELAYITQLPDSISALIEPAFVVVGHQWHFYLAYLHPSTNTVHILRNGSCSTESISGVFQVLRMLRNVIEYGIGGLEDKGVEGKKGYWSDFLGPVLEKLAGSSEMVLGSSATTILGDEAIYMESSTAF